MAVQKRVIANPLSESRARGLGAGRTFDPHLDQFRSAFAVLDDLNGQIQQQLVQFFAEIGQARSAGFIPVSLGKIILRAETAAFFALSAIAYELME